MPLKKYARGSIDKIEKLGLGSPLNAGQRMARVTANKLKKKKKKKGILKSWFDKKK